MLKYQLLFSLLFFTSISYTQINDCIDSELICSSESLDFNPNGAGDIDLNNSNSGCLEEGEHSSAWYYFQINEFAPANTPIAFLIIPENGSFQDYDFALYGPDVSCDDLGAPIRCSYAATSPSTGLQIGSSDFSEDSGGDGYVAPINVNSGQGYYLLIDNYSDDGIGFALEWDGDGADYLDCDVTPPCAIQIDLVDSDVCIGENLVDYDITLSIPNTEYTVEWSSATGQLSWITNPFILNPDIEIQPGFSGTVQFEVTVSFIEINCIKTEMFTTNIFEYPIIEGMKDELIYCSDAMITIGPSNMINPIADITWTRNGQNLPSTSLQETNQAGEYIIAVSLNDCPTFDTLIVEKIGVPIDLIALYDSTDICAGLDQGEIFIEELEGGSAPYVFELNTGEFSEDFFFSDLSGGDYTVTVTDVDGCTKEAMITLDDFLPSEIDLGKDTLLNLGQYLDKNNKLDLNPDEVATSSWTYEGEFLSDDLYNVNFQPSEEGYLIYSFTDINGCDYVDSIRVRLLILEQIYIANQFTPNGDDVNDIFYIQGGPSVSHVNTLAIYSRWGEKVFEMIDVPVNEPSYGWDGLWRSRTINSASFQYLGEIELIDGTKIPVKGSLAVIR